MHNSFWNRGDSFRNEAEMFRNIAYTGISRNTYWKEDRPKVNHKQPKGLAEVPMFIGMLGRRAILYSCKRVLNSTGARLVI